MILLYKVLEETKLTHGNRSQISGCLDGGGREVLGNEERGTRDISGGVEMFCTWIYRCMHLSKLIKLYF